MKKILLIVLSTVFSLGFFTMGYAYNAEQLASIRQGVRSCEGAANLSGTRLNAANLTNTILRGANLSRARLDSAILSNADLLGADLSGAVLVVAQLTNANLTNANLAGAILTGANLGTADLTNTTMPDGTKHP